MDSILKYFAGEKLQCSIGILVGLLGLGLAIYFIYLNKPMLKGVAYVFIPLSLLLLAICIGIVLRTPKDITRVTTFYETEPAKMLTDELPRMEKVMQNFPVIKAVELGFILIGLCLWLFFARNALFKGIGLGLVLQGVMLFGFDYFAHARGKVYFEYLKTME